MDLFVIVGVVGALAVLAIFVGLARAVEPTTTDRLQDFLNERALEQARPGRSAGLGSSAGELVQGFDKIVRSVSAGDRLAHTLRRADSQLTVTEFLLLWLFCIVASVLFGYVISHSWLPAALTGVIGVLVPYVYIKSRQAARVRAFNDQLHNVLLQLSGSLRAGHGALQAIDFVAHQSPPPAGKEFAQVIRDVKLGRSMMDALDDMLDRIDSEDLRLVVTSMHIQYETGGNLAEILETVAETIRERVRIKGELRALTAQQRGAGYVLAALPIVVFLALMLINPSYEARLFAPGPTLCIPIGAIVTMVLGFLIIRRIVALEV